MLLRKRNRILPSEEEVAENERIYLETKEKLDRLVEEYNQLKSTLRCRYCGNEHYASGYCVPCYVRTKEGKPLVRKKMGERERRININSVCENGFSPTDTILANDLLEIVTHSSLDERNQNFMKMYFIENKTYAEIGEKYGITRERVRQSINKAMRKCNLRWK